MTIKIDFRELHGSFSVWSEAVSVTSVRMASSEKSDIGRLSAIAQERYELIRPMWHSGALAFHAIAGCAGEYSVGTDDATLSVPSLPEFMEDIVKQLMAEWITLQVAAEVYGATAPKMAASLRTRADEVAHTFRCYSLHL